jgi:hypothetical protein
MGQVAGPTDRRQWKEKTMEDQAKCEECGAVDTDHVDVHYRNVDWLDPSGAESAICEHCWEKEIRVFAADCADEAVDQAATTSPERRDQIEGLAENGPLPGDWDAAEERFDELDADDQQAFGQAYRRRVQQHVDCLDDSAEPGPARLSERVM